MAAVAHKHIKLLEGAFVEELCDALAGGVFAALVLLVDGFLTTAETCFVAKLDEFFYFFELVAHYNNVYFARQRRRRYGSVPLQGESLT